MGFTQVLTLSRESIEKASEGFPVAKSKLKEMHAEIKSGITDSLKLTCYYCGGENHIAPECPEGEKYMIERNIQYKHELSTFMI